jgi:hypothetical protein
MSFIFFDRFDLFKYRVDLWSRSSVPARAKTVSDARITHQAVTISAATISAADGEGDTPRP